MEKLNKGLFEKVLNICKQNYIYNLTEEERKTGFLITENYEDIIKNASYFYIDDKENPTYIYIFYTADKFKEYFNQEVPEGIPEGFDNVFAGGKKRDKENPPKYRDFFECFVKSEQKRESKGIWGEIVEKVEGDKEDIRNDHSIRVHTHLGFKRIGGYEKSLSNQLNKKVFWGVYILEFNSIKL